MHRPAMSGKTSWLRAALRPQRVRALRMRARHTGIAPVVPPTRRETSTTKLRFGGLIGLACALLVPCGHTQLASSSNFKLTDYVLDSGGGGTASANFAAWMSIVSPSKGAMTSPRFAAGIGILETSDPQPTNGPVIFGITQPFGPKAGGNLVSISGLNFDRFGSGPSVTLDIGGNAATRRPGGLQTVIRLVLRVRNVRVERVADELEQA